MAVLAAQPVARRRQGRRRRVQQPVADEDFDQRGFGQRLRVGGGRGVGRDLFQRRARAYSVAGVEQGAGRGRAGLDGEGAGHEIGEAVQGQPAHPLRFGPGNGGGAIREAPQRQHRVLRRRCHRRREQRPRPHRIAPPQQQLRAEPPRGGEGGRSGERADHLVVLVLRRIRELRDRVRGLGGVADDESSPFGRRGLPIAGPLRQVGELECQRRRPAQRATSALQHRARIVELALVLERHRPLAPRGLIAGGAGDPALGGGPHAVGLVEPRVHAQLHGA